MTPSLQIAVAKAMGWKRRSKKLERLLRRIPLGPLRVSEHRQLYLDVCAALNIEPWVEK